MNSSKFDCTPDQGLAFPVSVSVLIPAHNAGDVLYRALASLHKQQFLDWEAIVVDDGSTDSTYEIAEQFARSERRVKVLRHQKSKGAAIARNTALEAACGRYIAFLDADDEWLPEKLEVQIRHIEEHEAVLSYSGFWRETAGRRHRIRVPSTVKYKELLAGNCIGCLTAIYDRGHFGSVSMPDMPMRQDYALWLKLLSKGVKGHGIDQPLAIYHVTKGSLSSNRLKAISATWSMYRDHFKIGRIQSTMYLAQHLLKRVLRG